MSFPARISPTKPCPSRSRQGRPTSSPAQPVSSFSTSLDGPHRPPTSVATAPNDQRLISARWRGWGPDPVLPRIRAIDRVRLTAASDATAGVGRSGAVAVEEVDDDLQRLALDVVDLGY